ncbi:MAG: chorismate synthase [Clostridia bacterium]|nr:chorismate synthase [Clostridia bacterium]
MGSIWGNTIKISVFGESHGGGIGVVVDGFPAGIPYDEAFILSEAARRAPGKNKQSTARRETDQPKVLSGIYQGHTTGTPISVVIENTDTRSGDYQNLIDQPRPGHADYTGSVRYRGGNDPRGGGHFSGRLTAPLVFAGALCKLYLKAQGVTVGAHIQSIAQIQDTPFDDITVDAAQLDALRLQAYPVINPRAESAMLAAIEDARLGGDSVGGVLECAAVGLPAGLGSPMFDTVEGRIASLLYGVPAVKGVEFGAGFAFAALRGSHANDAFCLENGIVRTETNNNGGVLGGITSGMPLIVRACIKPTPSIARAQETLKVSDGTMQPLTIHGRHDPCIVTRAAPVVEAAVAIALADLIAEAKGYA